MSRHANASVGGQRLFHERASQVAVTWAVAVKEHFGVEAARLGALDFERQFLGLEWCRTEVLLGDVPVPAGGGADAGHALGKVGAKDVQHDAGGFHELLDERVEKAAALSVGWADVHETTFDDNAARATVRLQGDTVTLVGDGVRAN